jgi:phospholipase C
MDMGKMDMYVTGTSCSNPENFAYAPASVVKPYTDLAAANAIADRYFQPIAGESSSNDMYLAVAKEVFIDNAYEPEATGSQCSFTTNGMSYTGQQTIADLLETAGKKVAWYSEGYAAMQAAGKGCPAAPTTCPFHLAVYPCTYDPGDDPFLYYSQFATSTTFVRDYAQLAKDLAGGTLPDVSYVKGLGYHTEHPGSATTITDGEGFVTGIVQAIDASCYKDTTLVLVTWDEGGGFFDHIAPPAVSTVDNQPYGTRVPLLAIGRFAQKGTVSHVQMEHSSIVKFLEWNFLGGTTGQLGARDAVVNNIGSLLDPSETGVMVPDQ